jgi:hypothetical protein
VVLGVFSLLVDAAAPTLARYMTQAVNDTSTLSTINFSLPEVCGSTTQTTCTTASYWNITDGIPGDWVQRDVKLTTPARVGTNATLTVQIAAGTGMNSTLSGSTVQAMRIRVESCNSTFTSCSGVSGLSAGTYNCTTATCATAPGTADSVTFSAATTAGTSGVVTLQSAAAASTNYYYKLFMLIPDNGVPANTSSGDDLTLGASGVTKWTWTITSGTGGLRSGTE